MECRQRRKKEGGGGGVGGGRHVFTRGKKKYNKEKRVLRGRQERKIGWTARREDVRVRGKQRREEEGTSAEMFRGLMLRNACSASLSPFPPHYPSTGQRRGGMTFSFVLLRAPYYHLSREISLPSSLSFFLLLPHDRFKWKFLFSLSLPPLCFSTSLFLFSCSLSLFCSIIA